jgi:hypothetical protein
VIDSQVATHHRAPAAARPVSLLGQAYRWIRDNRALVILLAVASVIRLLIMIAYRPALWYGGDSGSYISAAYQPVRPQATFAIGYSAFLKPLRLTGTLFTVTAVQHLLGLLMAVAIYMLLRHLGVRRWVACLAVVPVLFDSLQLLLEHTILVETLATSLMVAALVLLFWQPKPGMVVSAVAGLLLITAWFVRPQLLPVIILVVVHLAVRRVGWRPWLAFVIAIGLPYLSVTRVFVGDHASPYTTTYVAYYARVAGFARCDQITLTAAEQRICPGPAVSGHQPEWYIWVGASPGFPYRMNESNDPVLMQFAIDVVRQQPLDYLRAAGTETAAQFVDGIPLRWEYRCVDVQYSFARSYLPGGPGPQCRGQLASADFQSPGRAPHDSPPATALSTAIEKYGSIVRTPRLAILGVYVLVVAAAVVGIRRRRRARSAADPARDAVAEPGSTAEPAGLARDAVALAAFGLAIIVLPTVIFMYASRYALPALPLLCLSGAMAAESLLRSRTERRRPAQTPAPSS